MSVHKKKIKILFAAGGTGGHIFPAVAVAEQLKKIAEGGVDIHWVGSPERMESQIIPELGYSFHKINISGITDIFSLRTILLPLRIYQSVKICRRIIREKEIDAVVATGAYISYPPGVAARKEGKALFFMESNVNPGKSIKMLSGRADKIFISFEESKDFYNKKLQTKIFTTGNPVRESILNMPDREAAYRRFDLDITKRTLLIFGGSLGASAINETVARSLDELEGLGLNIIWQTGNSFKLESVRENIRCYKFIEEMGYAYSASDLVVSRSGATTVAELCIVGKPSILIPLPGAANSEQYYNARILEQHNACLLIENDKLRSEFLPALKSLLRAKDRLSEMGKSAKMLAKPDAAKLIAESIIHYIS